MTESTSLYRRHRPGSFDEVVGQQHVVRTLRNAVEQDKIHHAYLFVGSRGTGKTSMAKILARSLNCERGGPTVTPCGECDSCRTIAAGTSVDVIEMDAASNRSVDDVRDLRERVAYAPAGGRWKVYILDEAHMLTKEAWNAFLKTLEEPPPKTVFVLATTESHKVMATIADRCQRFDFQRPSLEQISEVLTRVAQQESIAIDEGAVGLIARSAQGSFRDALGTLDQLVAFGGANVAVDDVVELLGVADSDLLFAILDAVASGDSRTVLLTVEEMARSGRDPSQFARDLLAHLRHLLVTQTVGEAPSSFVASANDADRLRQQAGRIGPATLVRTIDELAAALTSIREGDEARMAVEIALLKAARPELDPGPEGLLRRIERLEGRLSGGTAPAPAPPAPDASATAPPAPDAASADPGPLTEAPDPEPDGDLGPVVGAPDPEPPNDASEAAPPSAPASAADLPDEAEDPAWTGSTGDDLERLLGLWPAVLEQVRVAGAPALAALFEGARPVAIDREAATLTVGFPPSSTFNKRKAESAEKREQLAAALEEVTGERLGPAYVMLDEDAPPPPAATAPSGPEVDEEALMERLKTEFDAEEVS